MSEPQAEFESPHFNIHSLTNGVHAAIAKKGGAAIGNAGIIDLGDATLVFDTCMTLQAARDLALAAQHLTEREAEIVVNSHYHNDHTWGNQVFSPHARIIATSQTHKLLWNEGKEELDWARQVSAQNLEDFKKQYEQAGTEQERREAQMWVGYYQGLVEDLPQIRLQLPDITFEGSLTFHGPARIIHLLSFSEAHTGDDLILHLPIEGILFMGDLLFVGSHPYLAECDIDQLLKTLLHIQTLRAKFYVPGHGPVGTKKDLDLMIAYVRMCREKAQNLAAEGKTTVKEIAKEKLPRQFETWELSRFFYINLQVLAEKYARTK